MAATVAHPVRLTLPAVADRGRGRQCGRRVASERSRAAVFIAQRPVASRWYGVELNAFRGAHVTIVAYLAEASLLEDAPPIVQGDKWERQLRSWRPRPGS
ncbi:hypothetical protein Aab01nite_22940 [Paractinoplanes abujensis]|nr:hypothetical protein Aab01nite_22940 [Actinoplanes abujensis]